MSKLIVDAGRVDALAATIEAAVAIGAEIVEVPDLRGVATTDRPQGVVAHAAPLPVASLSDLTSVENPAILVLDHVMDPRNLGAAARSAVAAGMSGMVVANRRAAPIGATAFKAAAGAFESLPVAVVSSIAGTLEWLRDNGVWLVGLDVRGEDSIFGLPLFTEPVAIVVGSEGTGLSHLVSERVDVLARIPHVGTMESLNASVATALAVFELARVRGWVT